PYLPLFLYSSVDHRDLHSFPTRRSSDLPANRTPAARRKSWSRRGAVRGDPCQEHDRKRQIAQSRSKLKRLISGNNQAVLKDKSRDRKSTRLNSSHLGISYAVFCLKKKKK